MRIEFRAPNLVRGFGPLVGSSFFYLGHAVSTPCHSKNLPMGLAVCFCDCLVSASCLGPPAFAFSSRQRLHWTGPVSCWHHSHLNTADVVSVRAHSVSAVCLRHCLHVVRKTTVTPTTCTRTIPFVFSLACPRIAHGHTPAAALDRTTSTLSRGNLVFPTHQPLCFSPAAAGAQSYIIETTRTTA